MALEKFLRWILRGMLLTVGLTFLLYYLAFRDPSYKAAYAERSRVGAAWQTDGVTVAVVWSKHDSPDFAEGVELALRFANERQGGKKRHITLERYWEDPSDSSGNAGLEIAHRVVRNSNVVAVLGHEVSAAAIGASVIYENHGVLFLTAKSTEPRLMHHGFRYTFRLVPNDRRIAERLTEFAKSRAWEKTASGQERPVSVGIFYARSASGQALGDELIEAVQQAGLTLKFSRSYLPADKPKEQMDFRPMIAEVSNEAPDVIMIADRLPRGAKVITDIRDMGMTAPILASDKFDRAADLEETGASDIYVASAVDPDSESLQYMAFRERFKDVYKEYPGYEASQGFETFMLLAQAISKSKSADPLIVATTIRDTAHWRGLFGDYHFAQDGEILNRHISIKRFEKGRFTTVAFN